MTSERINQEFTKLFPDVGDQELVKEFKCCMNKRTNRGVLYLSRDSLFFYSKMLGETKLCVPLKDVTSLTLSEPSVDQHISVVLANQPVKKFLYFQQDIEESFSLIEQVWKELQDKLQPKEETVPKEETKSKQESREEETENSSISEDSTISEDKNSTKPSNSIKDLMRQRQIKAQKQREESEAKIKAKASISRQKIERNLKVKSPTGSLGSLINFLKQFLAVFVLVWICSFIMPNHLVIDSWRGHFALAALLGSLKIVLDLESVAMFCSPHLAGHLKAVPEDYINIACLFVFKILLLSFSFFVVTDVHLSGILAFIVILIVTSGGEIARLVTGTSKGT